MTKSIVSFSILVLCFFVNGCGYGSVRVPTGAMQPTIPIDSFVVWDKSAYLGENPVSRFDLVLHTVPLNALREKRGITENERYIFRVIGLGGEEIEVIKGIVFVNKVQLEHPFEINPSNDNFGPIRIPDNEFFLLGDNRSESEDSRYWKPATIGKDRIIGKVVKIF